MVAVRRNLKKGVAFMATKYIAKTIEVDAEQFDKTKEPNLWPAGVQINATSSTGYSYGTLEEKQAPMGPGYIYIDGFPLKHLDYLVTDANGSKFFMAPDEFTKRFVAKI